jgi:hypothetical protein
MVKQMQPRPAWYDILASRIEDSHELQRIARELEVHPLTLVRWIRGETKPRRKNLVRLPDALPQYRDVLIQSLQEEFPTIVITERSSRKPDQQEAIPAEFYAETLHTYASIPKTFRFTKACELVIMQALKQLDPTHQGMAITVARCMPPSHGGKVRSLREVFGRGTPPWPLNLEQFAILLGTESLTGYAVTRSHMVVNAHLRDRDSLSAGYPVNWEESAAAAPILRSGLIAGSLLVSSARPNHFTLELMALVLAYADLLASAFDEKEYYEPAQIGLWHMPPSEIQQPHFAGFQDRISQLLVRGHRDNSPIDFLEAELQVWQQIEDELYNYLTLP